MSYAYIIEEMGKKGEPHSQPRYYHDLRSFKDVPPTVASVNKCIAFDGSNWNYEAAIGDANDIMLITGRPNRVRGIEQKPVKFVGR